jgi:hypothetical protein
MTKEYTPQELLALPMGDNDANADTVGGYLIALTHTVWNEGEGFSGKRPFGNSGWYSDLWKPFIVHEVVDGELDEYGDVEHMSDFEFDTHMSRIFTFLHTLDWKSAQEYREPEDWYVVYLDVDKDGFPTLTDYCRTSLTEKEAKRVAQEMNGGLGGTEWRAVHIPK